MNEFVLRNLVAYVLTLLLFAHSTCASEAADFPGVRQLMSKEKFDRSGLHKLSSAEIDALNEWLIDYTAKDAEMVKSQSAAVKKAAKEERVEAKITGEFNGWNGDTVFHLDNGQVWKQRLRGRNSASAESPEIVISKNWMGFYRLTVVSSGRSVGVKRIK